MICMVYLDEGHHVTHLHGGIRDLVAADPLRSAGETPFITSIITGIIVAMARNTNRLLSARSHWLCRSVFLQNPAWRTRG